MTGSEIDSAAIVRVIKDSSVDVLRVEMISVIREGQMVLLLQAVKPDISHHRAWQLIDYPKRVNVVSG